MNGEDRVELNCRVDRAGHTTWTACYRGITGHGSTRKVALFSLKNALAGAGIPIPAMPEYEGES
jgi:hypothetical protein